MTNSWQKDLFNFCEQVAQDTEQALWKFADSLEETAVEVDRILDQLLTDFLEPLVDVVVELDATVGEATQPLTQIVNPTCQGHSACIGCRHYHGQSYGGNLFVCAMHPYGVDEHTCPDWEGVRSATSACDKADLPHH